MRTLAPMMLALSMIAVVGCGSSTPSDEVPADVLQQAGALYAGIDADAHLFHGTADLNNDGQPEIFVHLAGPALCGTGGCTTLVFTPTDGSDWRYDLVAELAPTQPPIRVSARETNGWRNILVHVAGGGMQAEYDAELAFNGSGYPDNPTDPSVPAATDTGGAQTVIAPYDSYTEGAPMAAP